MLSPVRTDPTADYYELTAKSAHVQILPGVMTEVWGYNGIFPGPTFEARTGRQVVLKLRNALTVPIVNHLHGGHTPSESDGYPSDFVLPAGGFTQSPLFADTTRWQKPLWESATISIPIISELRLFGITTTG